MRTILYIHAYTYIYLTVIMYDHKYLNNSYTVFNKLYLATYSYSNNYV